jgi:segregation and condensation protein B
MKLKTQIESLLFVATHPIGAKGIFNLIKKENSELKMEEVEAAISALKEEYAASERGIRLIEANNEFQLVSSPEAASLVKKFLRDERVGELTQPSLETLTIIAYRAPVSKVVIEQIRGINCTMILRNLMIRGLVESFEDGAESFFNVTTDFLKYLGLNSVKELPDYDKLHQVENLEQFLANREISNSENK